MKHELVFHGVPRGHQVWPGTHDKYYETFYGSEEVFKKVYKDVKSLMILEIRKFEERYFSYYTFINYKNVIAEDGRAGSYFAMTFKVDGHYCTAVHTLYDLLSQVYEKYVFAEILSVNGASQKYKVSSFEAVVAKLTAAAKVFTEQINTNFANDFEEIATGLVKKYAERNVYYNLNDIDSQAFFDSTLNYGKILISPEYQSKDTKLERLNAQYSKASDEIISLKDKNEQLDNQNKAIATLQMNLNSANKQIEELSENVEKYSRALKTEKAKTSQLEMQQNELSRELKQYRSQKSAREIVERIEQPLCELADILKMQKQHVDAEPVQEQPKSKKSIVLYSVIGVLCALLIGLGWYTLSTLQVKPGTGTGAMGQKELLAQVDSLTNALEAEMKKYAALEQQILNSYSNVRINIKEYNQGDMKVEKSYTAEVKSLPSDIGTWEVKGFDIADKKKTPTAITVKKEGKVEISYYICGVKVATREFNAVK